MCRYIFNENSWKGVDNKDIVKFYSSGQFIIENGTVADILYHLHHSSPNLIYSFPDCTEEKIKDLSPDTKCRMYLKIGDGDYCSYNNYYLIEIL